MHLTFGVLATAVLGQEDIEPEIDPVSELEQFTFVTAEQSSIYSEEGYSECEMSATKPFEVEQDMDQTDPYWTKGGSCACAVTDPGTEEAFNWWKGTLEDWSWSQVSHVKILPRGVWGSSWRQAGGVEIYVGDQFCGTTPAEWEDGPAW